MVWDIETLQRLNNEADVKAVFDEQTQPMLHLKFREQDDWMYVWDENDSSRSGNGSDMATALGDFVLKHPGLLNLDISEYEDE